jgi:hypothetical protein
MIAGDDENVNGSRGMGVPESHDEFILVHNVR